MLEVSKIVRRRVWTYNFVFLNPCLNGSLQMPFSISLTLYTFVLSFLVLDRLRPLHATLYNFVHLGANNFLGPACRRSRSITRSVWRERFTRVRGLPDKGGFTKWPCLGGVPRHHKRKKKKKMV
jgi:hypothetical protein